VPVAADPAPLILDRVAAFARGRAGWVLAAAWGFAEAILLPVVPDVALDLFVVAAPRSAPRLFVAATLGAVLGTVLLYALAVADAAATQALILAVPGIDAQSLAEAGAAVATGDPGSMALFGPGIPLKVYTVGWATGAGSLIGLLAGTVLNRVTRIGPGLVVAAALGLVAPSFLRRWERPGLLLYVVGWVVFYALYLGGAFG